MYCVVCISTAQYKVIATHSQGYIQPFLMIYFINLSTQKIAKCVNLDNCIDVNATSLLCSAELSTYFL